MKRTEKNEEINKIENTILLPEDTLDSIQITYTSPENRTFQDSNLSVALQVIHKFLVSLPKKEEDIECYLCQEGIKLSLSYSSHELVKEYSKAIFCITQHVEKKIENFKIPPFLIIYSFFLEMTILNEIIEHPLTIQEIINDTVDTPFLALQRDQLIATSKSFILDTSINIYCEQDIESLTYKLFKKVNPNTETFPIKEPLFDVFEMDLLLFLLTKRRETARFFKIFNTSEKTFFRYKLSLILTLNGDADKSSDQLLREIERQNFVYIRLCECKKCIYCEIDDIQNIYKRSENEYLVFKDEGIINRGINNKTIRKGYNPNKEITPEEEYLNIDDNTTHPTATPFSISSWFASFNSYYDWLECVRIWNLNKDICDNVDTSMLDVCLKFDKYEEGWLIWEKKKFKSDICITKLCMLCVKALKSDKRKVSNYEKGVVYKVCRQQGVSDSSEDNTPLSISHYHNGISSNLLWSSRLEKVLRIAVTGNMKNTCCTVTSDILAEIASMEEDKRLLILNIILDILCHNYEIKCNDEIVHVLLKGLLLLCIKCNDSKNTCDLCISYADKVYNTWQKEREKGFLKIFFKPKMTCISNRIYCDMLSLCDCVKEVKCFKKVVKDLLKTCNEINSDVCCRVEKYHRNRKCKCGLGVNDGKKLLKHVIGE